MSAGANADAAAVALEEAAGALCDQVDRLDFGPPVTHVYNPLVYAWEAHRRYIRAFASSSARVVFLGMNPGPWGMAQTGVPFGEVNAVRDWLGITAEVASAEREHPKRPVMGLQTTRSEVSGRRLWGLFQERYGSARRFFSHHFVANYCPLLFLEDSGRNRTPDKLPVAQRTALFEACDAHLRRVVAAIRPDWVIGVGAFAETRARAALGGAAAGRAGAGGAGHGGGAAGGAGAAEADGVSGGTSASDHDPAPSTPSAPSLPSIGRILHPSPASPRANRGWAEAATEELLAMGVWE